MSVRAWWGLIVPLIACVEPARPLRAEGDPCRTLSKLCVTEESVLICDGDVWTERSCDEICLATGPGLASNGCQSDTNGVEACVCAPPPGGCTPGEAICANDETLALCDVDWAWVEVTCDEVCAQGAEPVSLGCISDPDANSACSCSSEGTPCEGAASRCVAEELLASCEAGVWLYRDCVMECGAGGECVPAPDAGSTCSCD